MNATLSTPTNDAPKDVLSKAELATYIVATFVILLNLLTMTILSQCTKFSLQIKIAAWNRLIVDTFSAACMLVMAATNMMNYDTIVSSGMMIWTYHIKNSTFTLSTLSMACMSIDRAFYILWPIRYMTVMTGRRMIGILVLVWMFSLLWPVAFTILDFAEKRNATYTYNFLDPKELFTVLTIYTVGMALVVPSSLVVVCVIRKHMQGIHTSLVKSNQPSVGMRSKFYRATISVVSIVGVYFMLFLPMSSLCAAYLLNSDIDENTMIVAFSIAGSIASLNRIVNPLLYVWRFKEFHIRIMFAFCFWNEKMRNKAREMFKERFGTYEMKDDKEEVSVPNELSDSPV